MSDAGWVGELLDSPGGTSVTTQSRLRRDCSPAEPASLSPAAQSIAISSLVVKHGFSGSLCSTRCCLRRAARFSLAVIKQKLHPRLDDQGHTLEHDQIVGQFIGSSFFGEGCIAWKAF